MTHIDPFAPADSPQHPANFYAEGQRSQTVRHEAMPPLLAVEDEPVWSDDPQAAVIGQQRWEEYGFLIQDYGTEEEIRAWDDASALRGNGESYQYSVTEPSLATLRARKADAEPVVPDPTGSATDLDDPATADGDLAQKLAALDEEDL